MTTETAKMTPNARTTTPWNTNPGIHIIQAPTGVWYFAGSGIPAYLAYVTKEGLMPTKEQLGACSHCGPGIAGLKSRTFLTRDDAQLVLDAWMESEYARLQKIAMDAEAARH